MSNKEHVIRYQRFLNSKGVAPKIVEDGDFGLMTTAATYLAFAQKNAAKATMTNISELSKSLGEVNNTRVMAVYQVETSGSAWQNDGLPKILWERHYFHRLSKGIAGTTWFSNSKAGDYTLDQDKDGKNDSWEKLCAAGRVDIMAAFQSFSMSGFQIMGDHYEALGYKDPWEMLWDVAQDEGAHYKLMVGWIKINNAVKHLNAMNITPASCEGFARFWNGKGFAVKGYHIKLANAVKSLSLIHGKV